VITIVTKVVAWAIANQTISLWNRGQHDSAMRMLEAVGRRRGNLSLFFVAVYWLDAFRSTLPPGQFENVKLAPCDEAGNELDVDIEDQNPHAVWAMRMLTARLAEDNDSVVALCVSLKPCTEQYQMGCLLTLLSAIADAKRRVS
jgi:hypothetical protein